MLFSSSGNNTSYMEMTQERAPLVHSQLNLYLYIFFKVPLERRAVKQKLTEL